MSVKVWRWGGVCSCWRWKRSTNSLWAKADSSELKRCCRVGQMGDGCRWIVGGRRRRGGGVQRWITVESVQFIAQTPRHFQIDALPSRQQTSPLSVLLFYFFKISSKPATNAPSVTIKPCSEFISSTWRLWESFTSRCVSHTQTPFHCVLNSVQILNVDWPRARLTWEGCGQINPTALVSCVPQIQSKTPREGFDDALKHTSPRALTFRRDKKPSRSSALMNSV